MAPPEQQVRRFAPTPVETSQKSSKKQEPGNNGPEPKTPRRFAVEPVEQSAKSSKQSSTNELPERPARKFAVEPVEQSSHTSRKSDSSNDKPKSRFAPQPFEMTSSSSKKKNDSPPGDGDSLSPKSEKAPSAKPRRTFTPQLIDTSSRSHKVADNDIPVPTTFKTDVTPGHMVNASGQPVFNTDKPKPGTRQFLLPHERRRERSDSHGNRQRHSFISPDLDTIESSESEPSNPPSLSTSPSSAADSPLTTNGMSEMYKHATRIRESVDESFSRYMLELEAKRAQMMLQEQALAAFPNSDYHEPVNHYVDEDDESDEMELDDRPATWEGHEEDEDERPGLKNFRKDTTKYNWELQELKTHHESLEQEKAAMKTTAKKESTAPSPWWNQDGVQDYAKSADPEYSQMMDQARPPMLGGDLYFPRSTSPEPARFDVTNGSAGLLTSMCYLTELSEASSTNPKTADGLWGISSRHGSHANSTSSGGLWNGFCKEDTVPTPGGLAPPSGPTGLMTPAALEISNPFEKSQPPTPSPRDKTKRNLDDAGMIRIDTVLNTERDIDNLMQTEYDDIFVTQVFNYLSLGYPSLARPFDEELSKISKVPLAELRHDDAIAKEMPRGYIRLGDDFEGRDDGTDQALNSEKPPARWRALKLYVREWVKQEKGMAPMETYGGYGTAPRRGSWAW